MKMGSPTPSIDSINDQQDYQSLSSVHSPLTASPTSLSSHGSGGSGSGSAGSGSSGLGGILNFNTNNSTLKIDTFGSLRSKFLTGSCDICHEPLTNPKVLPCLHSFCKTCLERSQQYPGKVTCAQCNQDCLLSPNGVTSLLPDFTAQPSPPTMEINPMSICTNCKNSGSYSVTYCYDCHHSFCHDCNMAHQLVNMEGHRVYSISQDSVETKDGLVAVEKRLPCLRHRTDDLKYFCLTCNVPICKQCILMEHPSGLHDYELISEVGEKQIEIINHMIDDSKVKARDLKCVVKNLNHAAGRLQIQYHRAQNEVNETFSFYRTILEERKQDILKELETVYSTRQMALNVDGQRAQDAMDRINQTCDFAERLLSNTSTTESLLFKNLLDTKFSGLINYEPEISSTTDSTADLEFVSNYQAIQVGARNTFGYIRLNGEPYEGSKQPPIARPNGHGINNNSGGLSSSFLMNGGGGGGNVGGDYFNGISRHLNHNGNLLNGGGGSGGSMKGFLDKSYSGGGSNGLDLNGLGGNQNGFEQNLLSKRFGNIGSSNFGPFGNTLSELTLNESLHGSTNGINSIGGGNNGTYEKWSNGGGDIFQQNGGSNDFMLPNGDAILDLTTQLLSSTSMFPPKSQIKRQKMIYHCKFGEFGAMESQFTEPSGVAVNAQNDIIVADTNNHRIQIFDKDGRYKFQFGECGKRDGQLLYPNRVAVIKHSGDIIVTERSPTHQIQIYNQYGQFVRKFGATTLQHPRGITVDNKGRIIVVECKVMRVIIFDQVGNVLTKFGCSKHLEFPNGVVVNDRQEIFISDNRAHCVKVFNYEGNYLRQIGSEGITNYPIGVGINSAGEILIADNHNNFNLTIFTQDGQLVSALESKVKHAQCFDVALMDDGSVVLASKDYRLYIYRYVQVPPIGSI